MRRGPNRPRSAASQPAPDPTAIELSLGRDDLKSPSPPTAGGEGWGEEGRWPKSGATLNPLPVRASRGEEEDWCLPAGVLNSIAVTHPERRSKTRGGTFFFSRPAFFVKESACIWN